MFSALLKFILGILLAIAVLLGGGVVVGLYFFNRTSMPPSKPVFANDNPAPKDSDSKQKKTESTSKSEATPEASATPTPSETPTEKAEELPKGAYRGKITWPQGVSLRSEPAQDSERVGGAGFNEKIIVLEESPDKVWKKVRVESSKIEGWTKVGNVEKVEQ